MSKFSIENNPFKKNYIDYSRFSLNTENPLTFTYKNENTTFTKSLWFDMSYYLHHRNHNLTIKSKKQAKPASHISSDSSSEQKVVSTYKNPWNVDNLKHIFNSSKNLNSDYLIDENAKYKTELEYHSNFGLFITRANRTYKPGVYFSMENFKKDLFSKLRLGIVWTDVYDHISTLTYLKFDKNPNFKNFLLDEVDKFNFTNPNDKLDMNLISKIDNKALGGVTSFLWDKPNSKHKIGVYFKIEQSFKSSKNQKMNLAFSWRKLKSFDLFVKMGVVGFSLDSLDEKITAEIRRRTALRNLQKDFFKKYSAFNLKANLNVEINSELMLNANFKIDDNDNSHLGLGFKYTIRDDLNKEHNLSFYLDNDFLLKFNADYALSDEYRICLGLIKNDQSAFCPYPYFNFIYEPNN